MFERFTDPARRVVVLAQEDARERRQDRIRTENLLVGVVSTPGTPGAELLREAGVDRRAVQDGLAAAGPDHAEALATLGIDLDEVRRQAEETFGPGALDRTRAAQGRWHGGHIPFDKPSKKALELGLREAIRLGDRHIGTEHLVLGLLWPGGTAHTILDARGVTLDGMREAVAGRGRGRASG